MKIPDQYFLGDELNTHYLANMISPYYAAGSLTHDADLHFQAFHNLWDITYDKNDSDITAPRLRANGFGAVFDGHRYPTVGEIALVNLQHLGFEFTPEESKRFVAVANEKLSSTTTIYGFASPNEDPKGLQTALVAAYMDPNAPPKVSDVKKLIFGDLSGEIVTQDTNKLIADAHAALETGMSKLPPTLSSFPPSDEELKNEAVNQQYQYIHDDLKLMARVWIKKRTIGSAIDPNAEAAKSTETPNASDGLKRWECVEMPEGAIVQPGTTLSNIAGRNAACIIMK